jgi:transposase
MERLNVHTILDIVYRLRQGQSERAIERDLGHSRHTIHRYHLLAQEKRYLEPSRSLPQPEEVLRELGGPPSPPQVISTVEPYRSVVQALLDSGVEMATIHRRLVKNHGYTGSYSAVKRFVHRLAPKGPEVVLRLETAPGQEAQVDFGGAGQQRDPQTGQLRQAYCFVMTLSFSRHQYAELVFDQKMATWIGCHRRAFEFFGGVPQEIVIDNLKAAVLTASLSDPILSVPYGKMAQHYGCLIHPCRPRRPQHKGKVENGAHYVKRSFLAGEELFDLDEANRKLAEWIGEEAGLREHGTTHEAPLKRFVATENQTLQSLPGEPFELLEVCRAKVHRDCYVQVGGCYYHAPYTYVGRTLDVYVYERTVQLYDGVRLIVTHERGRRKGQRISRAEFYPAEKSLYVTRNRAYCRQEASLIGPHCIEVVERLLAERPLDRLRSVQGILRLAEKYGARRVEAACGRAVRYGDPSYVRVKKILAAGLDDEQRGEPLLEQLPLPPEAGPVYQYARSVAEFFGPSVLAAVEGEVGPC